MSVESVTHDTDAILVQYAPQSRDVDVCISKMQDRIEQLERERDDYLRQRNDSFYSHDKCREVCDILRNYLRKAERERDLWEKTANDDYLPYRAFRRSLRKAEGELLARLKEVME